MRHHWMVVLLVAGQVGALRPAYCQQLSPRAERLFSEGLKLAREGDCARGREKFSESYAIDPAPGTLINWAVCEENLGRSASALGLLTVAEKGLPANHPKRAGVVEHLQYLKERVPFLRMQAAQLPTGTTILKDGVPVDPGTLGQDQPIDPGAHVIEIRAPGRQDRRYQVVLNEGRTLELPLEPGPPVGANEPPDAAARGSSDDRWVGWLVGSAGVAAIGVGTVTGLLAKDRWDTVKKYCNLAEERCEPEGLAASQAGATFATVSTIAFIAGGIGLAAGGYLVFFRGDRSPTTTRFSPAAGPGVVGLDVRGVF